MKINEKNVFNYCNILRIFSKTLYLSIKLVFTVKILLASIIYEYNHKDKTPYSIFLCTLLNG